MKGRLNSTLTLLIVGDAIALFTVFFLAYSAGAQSGGLSIADFGSLPSGAGIKLLTAFVICAAAASFTWIRITNKVLVPVKGLADFAQRLAEGDYRARVAVDSGDDFGFIAENLNRA
ncbi:MAG TPA: HAMP domain-containing protein, partial [Candidatus Angelobacter sp.]|nr:HAMP domain-containing protein [Candidatus Angelobacter sp.]